MATGAGVAAYGHIEHAVVAATALVEEAPGKGAGQAQLEAGVVGQAAGAGAFIDAAAQQAMPGQRRASAVAASTVASTVARWGMRSGTSGGRRIGILRVGSAKWDGLGVGAGMMRSGA